MSGELNLGRNYLPVSNSPHFVWRLFFVSITYMNASPATLGVDIGNVIINHRLSDPNDKAFHEEYYSTIPETKDVFASLKILNEYFDGRVYLISKCSEWAQEKILHWLADNHFYQKTGIKRDHAYFVRERHEKDGVCRKLGITHFVDDRLEVLSHMIESTPHLFLYQPNKDEVHTFAAFLSKVTVVEDWKEIVEKITKA